MQYYTVEQVSEKLSMSKLAIYRFVKSGRLEASKVGKRYLFTDADIEKLMAMTRTADPTVTIKADSIHSLGDLIQVSKDNKSCFIIAPVWDSAKLTDGNISMPKMRGYYPILSRLGEADTVKFWDSIEDKTGLVLLINGRKVE